MKATINVQMDHQVEGYGLTTGLLPLLAKLVQPASPLQVSPANVRVKVCGSGATKDQFAHLQEQIDRREAAIDLALGGDPRMQHPDTIKLNPQLRFTLVAEGEFLGGASDPPVQCERAGEWSLTCEYVSREQILAECAISAPRLRVVGAA